MTENVRTLARDITVSNDTHATRLNNSDLIIGPSGCGKTTGYVIPNILGTYGSFVVADTKNTLADLLSPGLRKAGYDVKILNFVEPIKTDGYNPLDYIGYDRSRKMYSDDDIMRIAHTLSPTETKNDPYWEITARSVVECLIAYVLETGHNVSRCNLTTVCEQAKRLGVIEKDKNGAFIENEAFSIFCELNDHSRSFPESLASRRFRSFRSLMFAEKTWTCVLSFVHKALSVFDSAGFRNMFRQSDRLCIEDLGKKKTVLFVNISDTDRCKDKIVNLLYTQLFQELCLCADRNPTKRLDIPVRIILDDFASMYIPDFDKIISVIRSREISVSIIIQSITQLNSLYGADTARTIINNCDHLLYLGGQDLETAHYMSERTNKPLEDILCMGLDSLYVLERGKRPLLAERIMPEELQEKIDELGKEQEIRSGIPTPDPDREVVIKGVPNRLLRRVSSEAVKFSFAYDIDSRGVMRFGEIILSSSDIIPHGRRSDIMIRKPSDQLLFLVGDSAVSCSGAEFVNIYLNGSKIFHDAYDSSGQPKGIPA